MGCGLACRCGLFAVAAVLNGVELAKLKTTSVYWEVNFLVRLNSGPEYRMSVECSVLGARNKK